MTTIPARRTLLAVTLVLTAAGCSPQEQSGRRPAAPDVRPLSGATALTHADAVRLHDAQERAVAACMTARGHSYTPQPRTASARGEETNPYGLLTPKRAAADGYGIVGEFLHLQTSQRPPGQPGDQPRDPAWRRALTGTAEHRVAVRLPDGSRLEYSADGCVSQARAKVYGADWNRVEPLVMALANRVLATVEQEPAYRAAVRRWSACMRRAGRPAADLQASRASLNSRLPKAATVPDALKSLGRDELRVAGADAGCQHQTGLADAVGRTQRTVERRLLSARDRTTIARYSALKQQAVATASETNRPAA
ncbi:hypothetical protein [Streptomyces sp. 8N616]|uniref:hypothetical protein n=1 Tax=Streptomyces sp. 8N616 TaxID=3457414 RepID=UPI003FCFEE19